MKENADRYDEIATRCDCDVAYIERLPSPRNPATVSSLADNRQQEEALLFFHLCRPLERATFFFLFATRRTCPEYLKKYVASISTFLSPCPLARFPFSVISPGKHRGRCPESRTAGARRPPASGVSAPVFHSPPSHTISRSGPANHRPRALHPRKTRGKRSLSLGEYRRRDVWTASDEKYDKRCEMREMRSKYRVFDK